jgi:hypothetical protein
MLLRISDETASRAETRASRAAVTVRR